MWNAQQSIEKNIRALAEKNVTWEILTLVRIGCTNIIFLNRIIFVFLRIFFSINFKL